jgi:hypothetical protein
MEPLRLAARISDLIVRACDDYNRHAQLIIMLLQFTGILSIHL